MMLTTLLFRLRLRPVLTLTRTVGLLAALMVGGGLPQGAAAPATRTVADDNIMLEFLNAPPRGEALTDVPRLAIGIGGALRPAIVDTGSTGVVLSATSIPEIERLRSVGPGTITYSSSGRIMIGRWVVAALTIAGRNSRIMTRPMPILAVSEIRCTAEARRCTPDRHPTGVAMLGIGFGREHDHQPDGTPDHNPLLAIANGSRSYVISRRGIRLGPDRSGFVLVRLSRDVAHGDWQAAPMCVTLQHAAPDCGTVLVDTGITGMFLTVSADRLPPDRDSNMLPAGTEVQVDLAPTSGGDAIGYGFRSGDTGDAVAPSSVTLAGIGRRTPFVNTGAHLLNRFDILYDAAAGLVGYRRVGN